MPKLKVYRCSTMDLPLSCNEWVRLEDVEKLLAEHNKDLPKQGARIVTKDNSFLVLAYDLDLTLQKVDAFTGEEIL